MLKMGGKYGQGNLREVKTLSDKNKMNLFKYLLNFSFAHVQYINIKKEKLSSNKLNICIYKNIIIIF